MNRMLNIFKEKSAKQKESVRTAQPWIIARLIEGSRRELRRWLSMVRARLTSATKFWQMIKGTSEHPESKHRSLDWRPSPLWASSGVREVQFWMYCSLHVVGHDDADTRSSLWREDAPWHSIHLPSNERNLAGAWICERRWEEKKEMALQPSGGRDDDNLGKAIQFVAASLV